MLKQSILLLLLIAVTSQESIAANAAEQIRFLQHRHINSISRADTDIVLANPAAVKSFELAEQLLSLLTGQKCSQCMCFLPIKQSTIHLEQYKQGEQDFCDLILPWTFFNIKTASSLTEKCRIFSENGFDFTEVQRRGHISYITITASGGKKFCLTNLGLLDRCKMFAAYHEWRLQKERAELARWSSARRAWVGSVVRSGNARKPFEVVAAELKE